MQCLEYRTWLMGFRKYIETGGKRQFYSCSYLESFIFENADSLLSDMVRNAAQTLSNARSVITNVIKNKVEIAGRELVYYFPWMSM